MILTKYEALKRKADNYKNRLALGIAYRDNLENGVIVSSTNGPANDKKYKDNPFIPFLSNRASTAYGFIDTDEFTETEMDMLKELVSSHVAHLEQKYKEAVVKLQAVEELLS